MSTEFESAKIKTKYILFYYCVLTSKLYLGQLCPRVLERTFRNLLTKHCTHVFVGNVSWEL